MDTDNSHYKVIMGDFNAKIGRHQQGDGRATRIHSLGERNDRGEMLIQFAASKNLVITNTLFKKADKRKWTWRSPNGETKNEIDFIMTNKRETVLNTEVIQKITIGSDHRMVRTTVRLNVKLERSRMVKKPVPKVNIDNLLQRKEEFQLELRNRFEILSDTEDDIGKMSHQLNSTIQDCAEKVGGVIKSRRKEKLKPETKALLKKRREMKKETTRENIEYTELCKTIRKKMRQDLREFRTKEIEHALETGKGLKKCSSSNVGSKSLIQSLKEVDGSIIIDRERIVERCAEYYENLYKDPFQSINATPAENIPPILLSEVEKAIRQMKNGKSPGEDQLVIETWQEAK